MGKQKNTAPVVNLNTVNWVREAHNFLRARNSDYQVDQINFLNEYVNNVLDQAKAPPKPSFKVGFMFVCINQPYWQYMKPVFDGVRAYVLPGHEVEIMVWTDMQNYPEARDVNYGATVFKTESVQWPYPTLMRYHFFLQEEEYLKKFDYIFYLDLDMRVVGVVGDEILGAGLTAAPHPMYALRQPLWYPYEADTGSAAYIRQPGRVEIEDGKKIFKPFYGAGGFQGGRTHLFLDAMKEMKGTIDQDLSHGYIARWNDESHWNAYLFKHQEEIPITYLDQSYVYPDSLIEEYYKRIWGRDFTPRIITLTKPFSTSKQGGAEARAKLANM